MLSRRRFFAWSAGALLSAPALARAPSTLAGPPPGLLGRAKASLDRHGSRILSRDTIGLVDLPDLIVEEISVGSIDQAQTVTDRRQGRHADKRHQEQGGSDGQIAAKARIGNR